MNLEEKVLISIIIVIYFCLVAVLLLDVLQLQIEI